jgi:hypothetical protein
MFFHSLSVCLSLSLSLFLDRLGVVIDYYLLFRHFIWPHDNKGLQSPAL